MRELITGYNWFAAKHGKEVIDTKGNDARTPGRVEQLLNEWVKLAKGKALAANGKIFEARDEILSILQPQKWDAPFSCGGGKEVQGQSVHPREPLVQGQTVAIFRSVQASVFHRSDRSNGSGLCAAGG